MIKGFAQVPNIVLWDSNLSLQAKGLWAYIKSKPPNWDFSCARIAQETKEGRKSILKAMKQLEEAGYLHRTKLPSGRVVHKIHPQVYKAPLSYEPPISFQDCREAPLCLDDLITPAADDESGLLSLDSDSDTVIVPTPSLDLKNVSASLVSEGEKPDVVFL